MTAHLQSATEEEALSALDLFADHPDRALLGEFESASGHRTSKRQTPPVVAVIPQIDQASYSQPTPIPGDSGSIEKMDHARIRNWKQPLMILTVWITFNPWLTPVPATPINCPRLLSALFTQVLSPQPYRAWHTGQTDIPIRLIQNSHRCREPIKTTSASTMTDESCPWVYGNAALVNYQSRETPAPPVSKPSLSPLIAWNVNCWLTLLLKLCQGQECVCQRCSRELK